MRLMEHFRAAITILILLGVAFALGDRRQVVDPISIKFDIPEGQPIYPGQMVTVQWVTQEFRHGCGGEVRQLWVDGTGGVVDNLAVEPVPLRYKIDDEKPETFYRERRVPSILRPGPGAVFAPRVSRWCPDWNVLQRYVWPMREKLPEVKFTVSPRVP